MTSDRELLERAAKAAGYDFRGGETFKRPGIEALTYIAGDHAGAWEWWNPLTDDGDAFRLAVKLMMAVYVNESLSAVDTRIEGVPWAQEPHNGDPYAATRRAIVRAAAAMAPTGEKP
jgi:hypothetical protein